MNIIAKMAELHDDLDNSIHEGNYGDAARISSDIVKTYDAMLSPGISVIVKDCEIKLMQHGWRVGESFVLTKEDVVDRLVKDETLPYEDATFVGDALACLEVLRE